MGGAATSHAFVGGRIMTMDTGRPTAEVVGVEGDRIVAVGDRSVLDRWPHATVVDLAGRTLVPGIIDAHRHLSAMALHPRMADLSVCRTVAEVADVLVAHAANDGPGTWTCGFGWRYPEDLSARDLDEMDLARPTLIVHYSMHRCLVNSQGLQALGIGDRTEDPLGGRIERDELGRATGVLVERAWGTAGAVAHAEYQDPDRWADLIEAHATALLAEGITAVHDAACTPGAEAAYRQLAAQGRLPIGVLGFPHPDALLSTPDPDRLEGPPTGDGDEMFRVGPVKLFADGGTDMAVDARRRGSRRVRGIRLDDVVAAAADAARHDFDLAIHAMGNAAVRLACEAIEGVLRDRPDADLRFRVEHVTMATADDLRRLGSVGATAVVQPGLIPVMGPNVHHVAWDDAKWFPFRSAMENGILLAASSDAPCASGSPLAASCHGETRHDEVGELQPEETVSYEDWLRAWTAGAARAGRQDDERGRLVPGLRADLAVLDGPLSAAEPPTVAETWVGGVRSFERTPPAEQKNRSQTPAAIAGRPPSNVSSRE